MKVIITIILSIVLLFAMGCAPIVEKPQAEIVPMEVPDLGQVDNTQEDVVEEPIDEGSAEEPEEELAPLGSRLSEEETVDAPEEVPEEGIEVMLFADKTMSETEKTVSVGDTIYYKNMDSFPHQLMIEQENPDPSDAWDRWELIIKGDRLNEAEVWEYTFDTAGEYVVRDTFSGKMRMVVTVE